jgi:hypothetical protein
MPLHFHWSGGRDDIVIAQMLYSEPKPLFLKALLLFRTVLSGLLHLDYIITPQNAKH